MDKRSKEKEEEYANIKLGLDGIIAELAKIEFPATATNALMHTISKMVDTYTEFVNSLGQVAMSTTLTCTDDDADKTKDITARMLRIMLDMVEFRVLDICDSMDSKTESMYGGVPFRKLVKELDRAKEEPGYDPRKAAVGLIKKVYPNDPEQQSKLMATLDNAIKDMEAKGLPPLGRSDGEHPDFKYI
jgi:hypothetical protein